MERPRLTQVESDYVSKFLKRAGMHFSAKQDLLAQSSSPTLASMVGRIRAKSPADLVDGIDEILVVSPPDERRLIAESRAYGPQSRLIVVSKPVILAAGLIGTATSIFVADFPSDAADLVRDTPRFERSSSELLIVADGWGRELANRRRNVLLSEAKRLLVELVNYPDRASRVAGRWIRFPFADTLHLGFAEMLLEFTLAHELAHHLLQHDAPVRDRTPPARTLLKDWLDEIDYELPAASVSHRHEFEADALAWRLLIGGTTAVDLSFDECVGMVGAAFGALPVYDQIEVAVGPLGRVRDTHPPIKDRARVLFELIYLTTQDQAESAFNSLLGRSISGSPSHFALQLWALRGFLSEVPTSPLWLPGEVPAGRRRGSNGSQGIARLAVTGPLRGDAHHQPQALTSWPPR